MSEYDTPEAQQVEEMLMSVPLGPRERVVRASVVRRPGGLSGWMLIEREQPAPYVRSRQLGLGD